MTTQEDVVGEVDVAGQRHTGKGDRPLTLGSPLAPGHGTTLVEADGTITYRPAATTSARTPSATR